MGVGEKKDGRAQMGRKFLREMKKGKKGTVRIKKRRRRRHLGMAEAPWPPIPAGSLGTEER